MTYATAEQVRSQIAEAAKSTSESLEPATVEGRLLLKRASDLAGLPLPPREWHVQGLIPASTTTLLSGDGGVGKSLLAAQLCVAGAIGKDWIGLTPRPGATMFLTAEDDGDELHRRIYEMASVGYQTDLAALGDFHFHSFVDDDRDPLLCVPTGKGDQLEMTTLWRLIEEEACDLRPMLIAFDSVADMFGGNEINRAQTRFFVGHTRRLARNVGAAVLLLGHPSVAGMQSGSGFSGSTAWNNSVRSRLYLTRPSDGANPLRVLSVKKANYAASGVDYHLRLGVGGYTNENGAGALEMALANDRVDALFLALLADFNAKGIRVGPSTGANYAPALFAKDPRAAGTSSGALAASMWHLLHRADSTP
jgi:hypothetical protein